MDIIYKQKMERIYFIEENRGCAHDLASYYYNTKEYHLLNYISEQNREGGSDKLMEAYYFISLYELSQHQLLRKKLISDSEDSFQSLISCASFSPEIINHLFLIMYKLLQKCENDTVSSDVKFFRHNMDTLLLKIISFSDKIGRNMTVINTIHGAIIIDCGAEQTGDTKITVKEFDDFFAQNKIKREDIKAVFISHAHYDHYGSIFNLVEWGIPWTKVFSNQITRSLIKITKDLDAPISGIDKSYDYADFQNNNIKIMPFENGHILGSYGFIIEIKDSYKLVYSGDFCYHNQKLVKGFDICNIQKELDDKPVDILILETTYGDRIDALSFEANSEIFKKIADIMAFNQKTLILPAFAIGRTQEIIEMLKEVSNIKKIGVAGLSTSVCEYIDNQNLLEHRIMSRNVDAVSNGSDKISDLLLHSAIVASSGMIVEDSMSYRYISIALEDDNVLDARIIKTGYISDNSAGLILLKQWNIEKNKVINISLSAHASYFELLRFIKEVNPKNIVQIHGNGISFN